MVIFHGFYQKMATEMNEIVGLPIEHGEFAWFLLVDQRVNFFSKIFGWGPAQKVIEVRVCQWENPDLGN